VDLDKKTIYYVEDYNVYQPGAKNYGHHYSLKNFKKLSNEEISKLINIVNTETNNTITSNTITYYNITYNGKTISSVDTSISNIINSLK